MREKLPECEVCQNKVEIKRMRLNKEYDLISCSLCKKPFERRLKPWNCPFSNVASRRKK